MENNNRNASASIFGWQFQINVAIFLMIKYFGIFNKLKVEGEKEDIEISLKNDKKIYAQAKSKHKIDCNNTGDYSNKLLQALTSLSDVNKDDVENLLYISNLEPNPLNSNTNEFELISFLKYDELSDESKSKIDIQLNKIGNKIDKTKLVFAKIPFCGEDYATRNKHIISKIQEFLAIVSSDLIPYSQRLLDIWESEFIHNATQKNPNINIKREDVLWKLLVFKLENTYNEKFDEKMQIEEEDYYRALEMYDKIINYKEADFRIYNKIIQLIFKATRKNPDINSTDFITTYEEEIYDIIFDNNKNEKEELIERACSKIIAKRIFLRKKYLRDMIERANGYEN